MTAPPGARPEDFTEAPYRELLRLARARGRFVGFPQAGQAGALCIWRHDVDFSVHRRDPSRSWRRSAGERRRDAA